jgi:hypothetical protein
MITICNACHDNEHLRVGAPSAFASLPDSARVTGAPTEGRPYNMIELRPPQKVIKLS